MDEPCNTSRPSESHHHSIHEFGYPSNEGSSTGPHQHSINAYAYPSIEVTSPGAYANMVSNAGSYSYSRYGNDVPAQEIGWDQGDFSPKDNRPYMIRWKSGKKVDQRLLALLETYFQEIYVKRKDFFKKIFPEHYDEFADIYNKIGNMLSKNNQVKHQSMQRSLSFGSPRTNRQVEELSELRLHKFKVKTPSVLIVEPDDQGGQISGPMYPTGGSNNSK